MSVSIKWSGPPASYTPGRPRAIRYIVLHTTEGSEGPSSAEDGNAYDKRRTDGVSTHYFTDSSGPAVQEVKDADTAHAALYHGNAIGIQIEICGRAGQSAAQWDDAASRATLATTAALVAHLCKTHNIPPVRLTVDQCRASWYAPSDARPKGIVDHYTVTRAYPEDGGTHTDVGPHFPWSDFLAMVSDELEGTLDAAQTRDAVWRKDDAVDNDMSWRTDSPLHDPPGDNPKVQGQTAILEAANRADAALQAAELAVELAKDNAAALARLEAAVAAIDPGPVTVTLTKEEIGQALLDALRSHPLLPED